VFNEEKGLERFHAELKEALDALATRFLIYYVDDGSTDGTPALLRNLAATDPRVRPIQLSRNFGHQAALTAGLDVAEGDAVITMDGDGQHPPSLIPQMLEQFRAGYDIVLTQRVEARPPSLFKGSTSAAFYWIINRLGETRVVPGSADFRLLSAQVLANLRQMREYHRFLRGMVAWMGYRTVILPYAPTARIAGESKYSLGKMVRLARDAVFSFSLAPLQIGLTVGLVFFLLACAEVVYVLSFWVRGLHNQLVPGWSSLMFMILVVGGVLTTLLGFIGVYVGYIFQEVKHRPIYLVEEPSDSGNGERPIEAGEAKVGSKASRG
jgi:dolichol-phosphate mannosyltransferase